MSNPNTFTIKTKVSICAGNDEHVGVLSKGTAALLRGIKDQGSLNKTVHDLHMAYSKAWRILKVTEEGFGFKLVDRDGARGSALTAEGEKILAAYEKLCDDLDVYAQKRYLEYLKELG